MSKVLICLDGSKLSHAVCDYGMDIAKKLDLPLVLLNVVEHSYMPKKVDLSGNIGLGSRDILLEELANEGLQESQQLIENSKATLKEMQVYVTSKGFSNYTTLQKHGTLCEALDNLSGEIKIAIIGLKSKNGNSAIGSHIEELLRALSVPVLLVNQEFKPIESMLMAYDGSDYAKKAIKVGAKSPIFPNINRYIVNINKDATASAKLLSDAKSLFKNTNIDVQTKSLTGDCVKPLLDYQEENGFDIIAMGAYSHSRFKSTIFGSFTTTMLLNSKVPLLLFR